jgi:poly-gamma-glutamate capsule biosynthesis protein CapA/YwtB (metallophosphatase superfamily)
VEVTTSRESRADAFGRLLVVVLALAVAAVSVAWWLTKPEQPATQAPPAVAGPVVAFGGDVNLGRRQNALSAAQGPDRALGRIRELSQADLAVVNLESVVAAVGRPAPKGEDGPFYFRGRPEMLQVLTSAGVDVVATANNHSGDYGGRALRQQERLLQRSGLAYAGSGDDHEEACRPTYRRAGDLTVAVLSVDATMSHFAAGPDAPGTCYLSPEDVGAWQQLAPRIVSARRFAHVVLVALHAGDNFEAAPDAQEVAASRAVVDAGADAVLGSSAHVLQGVEVYRGRPIIYDAGNLLFDFTDDQVDAAVFALVLGPDGVRQVRATPVVSEYGATRPADADEAPVILGALAERSRALGSKLWVQGQVGVLAIGDPPDRAPPPSALPDDPDDQVAARPPAPLRRAPTACTVASVPIEARIRPRRVGPLVLLGAVAEPTKVSDRTMVWVDTYWVTRSSVTSDLWIQLTAQPDSGTAEAWRGDHEPCDWMWPTSRWRPGVVHHDRYGLRPPETLQDADLELLVGLQDGNRTLDLVRPGPRVRVAVD